MPTSTEEFQDFQLETTDYRSFYTQRESARGEASIAEPLIRRRDVNTDGDGFDPVQRFVERMPDGFDAATSVALVGDEGTFGGNLLPRYMELLHDMPDLCGTNARVSIETLPDGRVKEVWKFPEGPRQIATETAYFGSDGETWLLQYGKLMSLMIETDRDGDTGGNKSWHFNKVTPNATMPPSTPQNAKTRISAAGVTGNLVLAVQAAGGVAKSVTLAIGDTAAQTAAKFAAQGFTVTAAGTIAVGAGEVHAVSGTGNALSVYGIDVFSKTIPTLQTAIRALDAAHSTATLSAGSTITQPSAGTGLANPTVALVLSGNTGSGTWQGPTGNYKFVYALMTALGETLISPTLTVALTTGASFPTFRLANTPTGTTNIRWFAETAPNSGIFRSLGITTDFAALSSSNNDSNGSWSSPPSVSAIAPQTTNTSGTSGTSASANLTITYDAAAGNIPDLTFVGPGYAGASTQPGAAGGAVDLEFTSPGNTPVSVAKTSGDAGYVISTTQAGSNGEGYPEIDGPEIHATHWLVFKAATLAALSALNMGNATTPADDDVDELVATATGHNVNFENLCQAVYLEDRKINPGAHLTRRPTISSSLTLLAQRSGAGIDFAEDVYATDNAGGCGTIPFWLRYAARCAQYEMWIDGKWSRNQQAAHPAKEGAAQWQFPLTRIHERTGSLFFTFIYPA